MSLYNPRKAGALCDICPRKGQKAVPPQGPASSLWVWVGQDPTPADVRASRPFSGPVGARMDRIWLDACLAGGAPIPRSEVWITNAALCPRVTNKEKEARDAVAACRPRLLNELKRADSRVSVLLMGKLAYLAVTGEATGMGGMSGYGMSIDLKEMEALSVRNARAVPRSDVPKPRPARSAGVPRGGVREGGKARPSTKAPALQRAPRGRASKAGRGVPKAPAVPRGGRGVSPPKDRQG